MWSATTIVTAFALGLVAMSFAFAGGAVIVAVPVAVLAIAAAGLFDLGRRRRQARLIDDQRDKARERKVDFDARDRQTLASDQRRSSGGG